MATYLQELAAAEIKDEKLRFEVLKACRGIGATSNAPESFIRIIGALERRIESLAGLEVKLLALSPD